jgi:hypothetical protein
LSYAARVLPSARCASILALCLTACATGDDSAGVSTDFDASTEPDAGDAADDAADAAAPTSDGSGGGDTGSDTSVATDTGATQMDSGGTGGDTGSVMDSSSDVGVHDAPSETTTGGCPGHGTTGTLVTFDLSAQSGSEASAPPNTMVAGISAGSVTRSSALTATSGAGSINSSGWGTGSTADPTRYYTFTVTPAAGCSVSLTSLALDVKASATGPTTGDVATSADSFATHSASFAGTSTPTVTLSVTSATGAIEIRIYGYGASSSGGTFRIQNTVTLSGAIQ